MVEETDWSRIDKARFALYGGSITLVVDIIFYPLEVIKTRMMIDTKSKAGVLSSFVSTLKATLKSEGPRGLFRGFVLYTAGGLPSQGAYFAGYGWAKDQLIATGVPPSLAPLAAGFFADAIAAPLWMPSEVITSRMQIQGPGVIAYTSSWHAAQCIVRAEGFAGLFRGLGAQVLAFGPASALWWASYEAVADFLGRWTTSDLPAVRDTPTRSSAAAPVSSHDSPSPPPPLWIHASSGLVAGLLTSLVTNPIDVAKTRLQTQHSLLREYDAQSTEKHLRDRADRLERKLAARKDRKLQFFKSLRRTVQDRSSHPPSIGSSLSTLQLLQPAPVISIPSTPPSITSNMPSFVLPARLQMPFVSVTPPQPPHHLHQQHPRMDAYKQHPRMDAYKQHPRMDAYKQHPRMDAVRLISQESAFVRGGSSNAVSIRGVIGGTAAIAQPSVPRTCGRRGRCTAPPLPSSSATSAATPTGRTHHPPRPYPYLIMRADRTRIGGVASVAAAVQAESAATVKVFRPITRVPFPTASTAAPPSGSVLDAIRSAAKAAVTAAGAARLGRLHRAPDMAAMLTQAARRAASLSRAAAALFPGASSVSAASAASACARTPVAAAATPLPPHAFYPAAARGVRLHTTLQGVVRAIVREEGAAALMRGLAPRLLTNGPASAVTLVCYELVKRWSTLPEPVGTRAGVGVSQVSATRSTLSAHE